MTVIDRRLATVADMVPKGACAKPPFLASWFRNLPGSAAFGRFTEVGDTCDTLPPANAPTAADYSLQLAATVSRALSTTLPPTFNACTWDTARSPALVVGAPRAPAMTAPAAPGPKAAPEVEIRR